MIQPRFSARRFRVPAVLLALALAGPAPARASVDGPARDAVRNAIVKIYTIYDLPDAYNPWSMMGPRSATGSGCVVAGRKILTNGHVVGNQTFLQVRRYGEARKYQARVAAVSHDADLALLAVDDPEFFAGVTPLDLGELPRPQQEVVVYGFPLGGDTLSTTKGVISRIEHQIYSHSSKYLLAAQMDAAINPGNSGGPALVDDSIVGVVMQGMPDADNIGYMVPAPIIRHFLEDIADGRHDGFPSLGLMLEAMENPDLKAMYRVPPDRTGMLVIDVIPRTPAAGVFLVGDVLMGVNGQPIADDGTIEFRPKERTSALYLVQQYQVGATVTADVWRAGQEVHLPLVLSQAMGADRLIAEDQYDTRPSYYIFGGLVFSPLTKEVLKAWGNNWYNTAPKDLVALLSPNHVTTERDQVVLLLRTMPAGVNEGYHDIANWIVTAVNGRPIRNLRELVTAVETATNTPYVVFANPDGEQVVLDRANAARSHAEILQRYRIPDDRSPDLPPPPRP